MQEKVDPVTGKSSRTIIESKSGEDRPRISIKDEDRKDSKTAGVHQVWPVICCP
jgi:DNA-directed RNA polymerase subunit beta'